MMLIKIFIGLISKKIVQKIPEGIKFFHFLCLFLFCRLFPQLNLWATFTKKLLRRNPQLKLWESSILSDLFNHFNGFPDNLQKKNS